MAAGAEVFLCAVIIETVIETGTGTGNGSGNGNEIEIEIATSGTLEIIAANQIAIGAGGTVTSMPEIPGSALAAPVHRETFVTFVTPAAAMVVTSRGCVAIPGIAWCLPHRIQRMVTPQGLGILRGGLLTESVVGETGKEGGVVVEVPTWTIETPFDAEVDPGTAGGSGIETETETATGTGTGTFGIAIANVIGTEIEIESIIVTATLTVAIALIDERTTGALSGMTVSGRWTRRSEIGRQIEMKAITCQPSPPSPPPPPPLRPLRPLPP